MDSKRIILASIVIVASFALATSEKPHLLFSKLPMTLTVTATPTAGQVLKAGEDKLTVTWSLASNAVAGVNDTDFKTVKAKLCYAPISQKQRGWRKTKDELDKDKTCSHLIGVKPYAAGVNTTLEYTVKKDIPQATYFIRAYAINADGHQVGYGQTTDKNKTQALFLVDAVTGRSVPLSIASICFSAFSVLALIGFFVAEKTNAKNK